MAYTHTPNEFDIFEAVRTGNWNVLATNLVEYANNALGTHKNTSSGGDYGHRGYSRRNAELKSAILQLPLYPLQGIIAMRHVEGSSKLLDALKKEPVLKRMDCSKLVMTLVKRDVDGLVWALDQGWGTHLGLLQSRQVEMNWNELRGALKTPEMHASVDQWVRQWVKKNPLMLQILGTPTLDEGKTMILEQDYVSSRLLKVLQKDDDFRGFITAMEGLGTWNETLRPSEQLKMLQPYFAKKAVVEMALPDDFVIEP